MRCARVKKPPLTGKRMLSSPRAWHGQRSQDRETGLGHIDHHDADDDPGDEDACGTAALKCTACEVSACPGDDTADQSR